MVNPVTLELEGRGVLRHQVAGLAALLHRLRQVGPHYNQGSGSGSRCFGRIRFFSIWSDPGFLK